MPRSYIGDQMDRLIGSEAILRRKPKYKVSDEIALEYKAMRDQLTRYSVLKNEKKKNKFSFI